jgi:hypothetical protein
LETNTGLDVKIMSGPVDTRNAKAFPVSVKTGKARNGVNDENTVRRSSNLKIRM